MIYPEPVSKSKKIGITATSSGMTEERKVNKLNSAIKHFTQLGYECIETDNVRKEEKLRSSSGEKRAKEFIKLWEREDISWIVAASGGEFLMEMLPYLDKERLEMSTPKWVQGFSDTSLLLYYLTTKYNIATCHAANFGSFGMEQWDISFLHNLELLENGTDFTQENFEFYEGERSNREEGKELDSYTLTDKVEYKNLLQNTDVKMEGRLIGGCIDVLHSIVGTKMDHTKKFCSQFEEGMLWYLESCELPVTSLYRTLWQMKECGWFQNANGFLIGRTAKKEEIEGYTYEDALEEAFSSLGVPVIYDIDVGHVPPQWTMINGSKATFCYQEGKGKLTQKWGK